MKSLYLILIFALSLPYHSFAQQSTCDYKVEILVDGEEFESQDFKWRMRAIKVEGKSTNITGTAEIEDSNGKTVKNYKPWTSDSIAKQKTSTEYSPNLKPGNYEITAEINVECDDTNKDNNVNAKTIKIKGEKEEEAIKKSSTKNTNLDEKDTNIVEEAKTSNQNEEQEQTNQNTKTITTKAKKPTINEETENVIQLTTKNNQKPQLTASAVQEPQIIYESSNERAKGLIMVFLLTLSILLNIILIWRR